MKQIILRSAGAILLVLIAATLYLAATPMPRAPVRFETPRWIGPMRVVDVDEGAVLEGQAIELRNGRIERLMPIAALSTGDRRGMADGGNAFVMPALWDMHALLTRYAPAIDHPLYLAHGVTRVRNILNCPGEGKVNLHPCRADKSRWSEEVETGRLLGPIVMGTGSFPVAGAEHVHRDSPRSFAAADAAQVRELLGTVGPRDHIKTYDGLARTSFFLLARGAAERGVELSGHVPVSVSLEETARAGFKAVAHARVLPIACSSKEREIMRLRSAGVPAAQWMKLALDHQDPARCAALWETLRERGTFLSPTLITRYNETAEGLARLSGDPATADVTPGLVKLIWQEDVSAIEGRSAGEEALYRLYYAASAARTAEAERAGVRLLLGSDTNDLFVAPGAGLHHEIRLWRHAGIPPRAILRAATVNAAAYFGLESRFGRVAPGHVADLVFLDANPLTDLSTLKRPRAVMQSGRLYDRATLDAARDAGGDAARNWRYTVHFLRDWLRNPLGFAT